MTALFITLSPRSARGPFTMLLIAYDPLLRARRIAPPSLRAAPRGVERQLSTLASDLSGMER